MYDLLERLIEKGLSGYVLKGRKKFFEATNPERLLEMLKEKEKKLIAVLPQLQELSKFKEKLDVRVYKGKEGIKTVLEDVLRSKPKEWLVLGTAGETYKILPYFLEQFHQRRIKENINAKALFLNIPSARKRAKMLHGYTLTEIKFLPKKFVTPTVINIYDERIALYSATEESIPFVILIENKEITKSFREYFTWLWQLSKAATFIFS